MAEFYNMGELIPCFLYTYDASDDLLCVDLVGRRNCQKKTNLRSQMT